MKKKKKKPDNGNRELNIEALKEQLMSPSKQGITNRIEMAEDIIDLHYERNKYGKGDLPVQDILFHQLDEFEKALDKAIAAGKLEMRVIHGLGKGKLKSEVYKILEKHPQVKSYKSDHHSFYGYGSTVIHFY